MHQVKRLNVCGNMLLSITGGCYLENNDMLSLLHHKYNVLPKPV